VTNTVTPARASQSTFASSPFTTAAAISSAGTPAQQRPQQLQSSPFQATLLQSPPLRSFGASMASPATGGTAGVAAPSPAWPSHRAATGGSFVPTPLSFGGPTATALPPRTYLAAPSAAK
jgi:hypothetical protein